MKNWQVYLKYNMAECHIVNPDSNDVSHFVFYLNNRGVKAFKEYCDKEKIDVYKWKDYRRDIFMNWLNRDSESDFYDLTSEEINFLDNIDNMIDKRECNYNYIYVEKDEYEKGYPELSILFYSNEHDVNDNNASSSIIYPLQNIKLNFESLKVGKRYKLKDILKTEMRVVVLPNSEKQMITNAKMRYGSKENK